MGRRLAILLGLFWGASAFGQDAPSTGLPSTLEGDLSWRRVGLTAADVADLAVVPAATGVWAAILDSGEVWVTRDAGLSFTSVLGPSAGEANVERRIQARIQELIDDLTGATQDSGFGGELLDEAAIEVLQREIAVLQDQLQEIALDQREEPEYGRSLLPRVWAYEDALFAGRADGLWRSDDLGGSWRRVVELPTHGLARVPGRSLWAAGTDDGMRFSVDGLTWLDPEDGTEGLQVADLAAGQDGVWAATADGVWFAADAQTWRKVGGVGNMLRVRPDPDWVRGAWVAAPAGILRTDDGGLTLREALGAAIPGVSGLLWLGSGRLLASGADGVWESLDGGTSWSARSRGLSDPDTRALAQDGTTLLLAARQGVYILAPGAPPPDPGRRAPQLALAPLLEAATERQELVQRTGNRWVATLVPKFVVDFGWAQASALDWTLISGTNAASGSAWGVTAGFTWTPRSQTNLDDALLPIDAVWLTDDTPLSPAFVASTTRDALRYRVAVSNQVADLYFARAELAGPSSGALSFPEAVEVALRVAEIDARLDSLTNGALSRLQQAAPQETP